MRYLILRHVTTFFVIIISIVAASCIKSTNSRRTVPSDDEERVYMLVATPGAEGDYDRAVAVSDSLFANCAMSDSLRAYLMIERDVALMNGGDIERGMAYADTLIAFGRSARIGQLEMQGEQTKGVGYRRKEMYDSAIACYTRGLDIAIKENNTEMEQSFADMLTVACTEIGHTAEALDFARRSLRLAEEMADTTAIFSAIGNIGALHTREKHYDEAIKALMPYAHLIDKVSPPYRVKFLTPLVKSYISLDSIDTAGRIIRQMEEAVSYLPAHHQSAVVVLTAKAMLFGREKRYRDQWKMYQLIDSLGTHGKTTETVLLERAECLANMGEYRQAYDRITDAFHSLDSVRRSDIDRELSDLSVRYDTLTKEIEIEHLSRQRWILISVILFGIMLFGSAILFTINRRKRQLRKAEHEKQQEYIRGLEQERSRMARELHDDVAGDLLGLQFELTALPSERSVTRLQEITSKVRRLSHELMPPQFADAPLTTLLIDYVRTHNLSHPTRLINLTDEGSFDWSSLTPEQNYELYRIVQESVNNALKHSSSGDIDITLDGSDRFSLSITNRTDRREDSSPSRSEGIGRRTLMARASIIGADTRISETDSNYKITISQK